MLRVNHTGWNWAQACAADRQYWEAPCIEGYFFAEKWREMNKTRVLDLGCGLGRQSVLFAQKGFVVTAMDASDAAIEQVKRLCDEKQLRIHACKGDMHALPFADDAFDAVWAYQVISHTDLPGLRRVIAEIRRVLRPEGVLYLTLCSKAAQAYQQADQADRIDENVIYKREETGDRLKHVYVDASDIPALFADFELLSVRHVQLCVSSEGRAGRAHYHIEACVHKENAKLNGSQALGKRVNVVIDRPRGSAHPRDPKLIYPLNYGYVPGTIAGDGAAKGVYVLGIDEPRERIENLKVIAVVHRYNDCEDKWIAAPEGMTFTDDEIRRAVDFVEQYFDSVLIR